MEQYISNISLAQYFDMVVQAAKGAGSDVSVLELQRLRPQLGSWEEIKLEDMGSLDELLSGTKQFHIVVRVPLSGKQDLVQSTQVFHYWQMHVPETRKRRTWAVIVTNIHPPKFDRAGRLLDVDGKPVD